MFRNTNSEESLSSSDRKVDDISFDEGLSDDDNFFDETYQDYDLSPDQNAELAKVLIETDSYINRIQLTLENKYLKQTRYKKDGKWEYTKIPTQIPATRPLANEFGISQIVGRIKSVFHHSITLGQISKEQYGLFMRRFIRDFVRSLIGHRIEWGVNPNDLRDIRRIVVDGVQLFITRPIGNIERSSLTRFVDKENRKDDSSGFVDNLSSKFRRK